MKKSPTSVKEAEALEEIRGIRIAGYFHLLRSRE
jgi:hypothetical protein